MSFHQFKTRDEAIAAGYRMPSRGAGDVDISGSAPGGGSWYGYQYRSRTGQQTVTVSLTEATNAANRKGAFTPMFPPGQRFTVEIQAGSRDGQIWQAVAPAENVTGDNAEEVAKWVERNQTVAEEGHWRVQAWVGENADTGTEPAAEVRGCEPCFRAFATADVFDGRISVAVAGAEDIDIIHTSLGVLPTLAHVEPWGEDEFEMDRADRSLHEMGWERTGDWAQRTPDYQWTAPVQPRVGVGVPS